MSLIWEDYLEETTFELFLKGLFWPREKRGGVGRAAGSEARDTEKVFRAD